MLSLQGPQAASSQGGSGIPRQTPLPLGLSSPRLLCLGLAWPLWAWRGGGCNPRDRREPLAGGQQSWDYRSRHRKRHPQGHLEGIYKDLANFSSPLPRPGWM